MPQPLSPGVYTEEVRPGSRPIERASTSTAGFLGATERGPEPPRLITSWLGFQRWYGGYMPDVSYLAYAVQGFFENGGQRCYIGRVLADDAIATAGKLHTLSVMAVGRGAWGNNIQIKVDDATGSPDGHDWFRVTILYYRKPPDPAHFVDPTLADPASLSDPRRREPDVLEVFDNLTHEPGTGNNVVTVLNGSSRLVRAEWDSAGSSRIPNQPFAGLGANGSDSAAIVPSHYAGSLDPVAAHPNELLGRGTGLAAMAAIDEISLLVAPDEVRNGMRPVTQQVINQCEALKDRFAIVAVEQGRRDPDNPPLRPDWDTSYAALYYPWIRVHDLSINDTRLIPPTGHIAGIFARTDIKRGVHESPANQVVRGAVDLEFPVSQTMQDLLNPRNVNCIRDFRHYRRGIRLWGARTMSSDPEWKYVQVRRLLIFIEESIDEGTQWVVFEPNDELTWAKVHRSIGSFLNGVWRDGSLMGTTQDEAFFVRCDRTTMTQDDIDNGRLICYVGVAPLRPAEFVIFRIGQKTAEAAA